ncbi:ParA family protein [Acidisphaera sp. S103]|uniref:ParA family protein n=1 Tax=Acidisphaera sp. S103 TaxID=1747223 RepID=UPI00131C814F|nr:ParA family protein [Acidisphaera sp. S103]
MRPCPAFYSRPFNAALEKGDNSRKRELHFSLFHNSLFLEKRNYVNLSFMKTIIIANQKGGSGKSTITVHLAAAAEAAGNGPVVISDTDPQGTAADWFNQRKKAGIETPRYSALTLSDLSGRVSALNEAGAAYLFIDTAPSIGAVNADLFALADLILIPLNPTPADLRALVKGLPLVRQSGKPFQFVLTRVRPNLRNNDGAAVALDALGLVLTTRMHERVIYAETFAHGKTAFETDAKGVAAQEIAALWTEIRAKLES